VDLRAWIESEHAAGQGRFEQQVEARVPLERWTEQAGGDGSSIAWLRFHTAWHEDLAVQCAVSGRAPVLMSWRSALGIDTADPSDGLGEAEVAALTARLDLAALQGYSRAVHDATTAWLAGADLNEFDDVPPAGERMVNLAGVTEDAVPWLHRMWEGKPIAWFVQWEAIGHPGNHIGEMVSVRNRLGFGGF
jgi:hypothetical protein